jgi:hypothetical protein
MGINILVVGMIAQTQLLLLSIVDMDTESLSDNWLFYK